LPAKKPLSQKSLYFVSVFAIRREEQNCHCVEAKSDIGELSTLDESKWLKTGASNFGCESAYVALSWLLPLRPIPPARMRRVRQVYLRHRSRQ
jgi:hypothetical protein